MPRKPRKLRKMSPPQISDDLKSYLLDGTHKKGNAEIFRLRKSPNLLKSVWKRYRTDILPGWIKENPCTRPWIWWRVDAPKKPVSGWDHVRFNSAQRKRLGGTGTPMHEVLGSWGGFDKGIPTGWVTQFLADYYNGRAKDIHGKVIPTDYKEGDFEGVPIDPGNPACL